VRTPTVFDLAQPGGERALDGPALDIEAIAFSRDGRTLATAGEGRVVLWSIPLGRALDVSLTGVPGSASAVTFSPDGQLVAAAAQRGVAIWAPREQALLSSLKPQGAVLGHVAPAQQGTASAAFSPDGRHVAWSMSGASWNGIVVWRLADSKEIARFRAARVAGFSPDGQRLAAAVDLVEDARGFVLVDLETGERRNSRRVPWRTTGAPVPAEASNRPWSVVGSSGAGASGGLDGSVTLWDTRRRQAIATLRLPGVVETPFLVFDRAGEKLAVATAGGLLTLVDLSVRSWRATACRLAARRLTELEWRLHVGVSDGAKQGCSP
jgi:WD40 repeat protein